MRFTMILLLAAVAGTGQTPSLAERARAAQEAGKGKPKAKSVPTNDDLAKYAAPGEPRNAGFPCA